MKVDEVTSRILRVFCVGQFTWKMPFIIFCKILNYKQNITLSLAAICVWLFNVAVANAVYVTPLYKTASIVRVCPKSDCPQMLEHPFQAGKRVVVYESRNGWVRLSKLIAKEKIQMQFPGSKLPETVALWIPLSDLPEVAAARFPSENTEEEKKADETKAKRQVKLTALPTPRPKDFRPSTAGVNDKVETEDRLAKKADGSKKAEPLAVVDQKASRNKSTGELVREKIEAKMKELDDASKSETEVASHSKPEEEKKVEAEPIKSDIELPKKLTEELKDKRLSKLPMKEADGLDMKSIIAMRYHARQLLENGSCEGIKEGGKSYSLSGWVYVICDGDYQYRQFAVE